MIVRQYRDGFPMNKCPPGSQGAREQLNTGPSGPLDVAAVNFQLNLSYGVFFVHPATGRLMRWVLDGRGYGVG